MSNLVIPQKISQVYENIMPRRRKKNKITNSIKHFRFNGPADSFPLAFFIMFYFNGGWSSFVLKLLFSYTVGFN